MIRIAVCDDEHNFVEQIHGILAQEAKKLSCAVQIADYTSGRELLYDVEEGSYFDLLFLDIEMPETDGMSLAAAVRGLLPQSFIVFITSHTKYAVKAYELSVFRYIPKSELEVCLPLALKDACRMLEKRSSGTYVIESPRRVQKIALDDILYLYKKQKYAVIVLANEEIAVRKSLEQMQKELCGQAEDPGFLMVERGYIVNLFHVDRMEEQELILDNGTAIPVSRRNQSTVRGLVVSYWRAKL